MAKLVLLDEPDGPRFIAELQRIWAAGNAAFPLDRRLPVSTREHTMRALRVGDSVEPGDALVLATSGTTGTPKGVVLTHDALQASSQATSAALDVDPGADSWLACLPLSHIGGLGVVLRSIHTGTPCTIHNGFDAEAVMASDATLVSLVPAVLGRIDPRRFRRILLGGSAIPPDRPSNSVATYGMTETASGLVYDGVPLDGVELRISDPDPAGHGEIHLRGPMLLRTYRASEAGNDWDPKDSDGWFATGDRGVITDGVLSVDGRVGDMIITGGENVWPAPVEAILEGHPSIEAAAIIGREDERWGQRVTAVVELATEVSGPPADLLDVRDLLDTLRALVKERLPAYCAPHAIEVVDALPRTALGKLRRSQL